MRNGFTHAALRLFLVVAMALLLSGFLKQPITSFDQFAQPGTTIATGLDVPAEALLAQDYPNAKLIPYSDIFLAYADVAKGRIDACVSARREMEFAIGHGLTGVRLLDENYATNRIAVGISPVTPIPDFRQRLNAFIREKKADGTLEDMYDRWVIRDDETMPDIPPAEDPKFTLRVGTTGTVMPYSYYIGTELAGYDIELAKRFASWLGADLEFRVIDFGGIVAAAERGSIDCIMSNLFYTEEKDESLPFSDVLFEVEITAMVRDDGQAVAGNQPVEGTQGVVYSGPTHESGAVTAVPEHGEASPAAKSGPSFLGGIAASFNRTFIREDRWRLFVKGVENTMIITVLSIIIGTALGFAVFMLCRNGNPVANRITRFSLWLVQGMPMVVLLMVLYYVIFGSIAINGIAVAVVGFALTFGAGVFGMLKLGVGAVDGGQYEAAYALGYSNRRTFYRIILPQALPHVLPAYKGEIVGLIKATAVVGYIAVQDLTKMGDIVRSRTYEAFFPLIAVTVIYFLLEGCLRMLVGRMTINLDSRRRKPEDILKGIKRDI